jgi:RNA polymerase sigma-70 factor (ECF subfamily)
MQRDQTPSELEDLILRAGSGERRAFDRLMRMHERQVFNTAWRLLGRVEDAEDAVQEVFLRLFRYIHRVDARRELAPWLYRVTVNVSNDLRRRRTRQSRFQDELGQADTMTDPAAGPDQVVAARQETLVVLQALDRLSTRQRTAVVLRDIEGLSTTEVARIMRSTKATVRSLISRARLKIREYRKKRGVKV